MLESFALTFILGIATGIVSTLWIRHHPTKTERALRRTITHQKKEILALQKTGHSLRIYVKHLEDKDAENSNSHHRIGRPDRK